MAADLGVGHLMARRSLPPIDFVAETGSTMDDVKELGRDGAPAGAAVVANRQTNGRGRHGSTWASPEGGLYLSVLLRPRVPMGFLMGCAYACTLATYHALRSIGVDDVAIAWPHDLVVDGRKLGGLLVEGGTGVEGVFAVFGFGMNGRATSEVDEDMLRRGMPYDRERTYLVEVLPEGVVAPENARIASIVRDHVVAATEAWAAAINAGRGGAGPLGPLMDEYFDALESMGDEVICFRPDGTYLTQGTLCGLDGWGRITVREKDGTEVELAPEQAVIAPA